MWNVCGTYVEDVKDVKERKEDIENVENVRGIGDGYYGQINVEYSLLTAPRLESYNL